jgi:hypothetical protein
VVDALAEAGGAREFLGDTHGVAVKEGGGREGGRVRMGGEKEGL